MLPPQGCPEPRGAEPTPGGSISPGSSGEGFEEGPSRESYRLKRPLLGAERAFRGGAERAEEKAPAKRWSCARIQQQLRTS